MARAYLDVSVRGYVARIRVLPPTSIHRAEVPMPDELVDQFGTRKPVIAMAHLGPLPYDTVGGEAALLDALRAARAR